MPEGVALDELNIEDTPPSDGEQLTDRRFSLAEVGYDVYPIGAHLTGRTPERIEREEGLPKEWLFPEGKRILYIGDPWQRMDLKGVTIVEMEFGEAQEFVSDEEWFRGYLKSNYEEDLRIIGWKLESKHSGLNTEDKNWLEIYRERLEEVYEETEQIKKIDEYPVASELWRSLRDFIEGSYNPKEDTKDEGPLADFRKDAWHFAIRGERGFKDLYDWERVIMPELEKRERGLSNLEETEREKILKDDALWLIRALRTSKKTEYADVAQATFPALPFEDGSFDIVVASWSISTHIFPEMSKDDFLVFWEEIYRVLKEGGEAYLFPLWRCDVSELLDSLDEFVSKHPDFYYNFFDRKGEPTSPEYWNSENWNTLVLLK